MPFFRNQIPIALNYAKKSLLLDYAKHIRRYNSDVGDIYLRLINRNPLQTMKCNFVQQVLDVFSKDMSIANNPAIISIDLDNSLLNRKEFSYLDIVKNGQKLASFLESQGINKGSSIALMLGQQISWWYGLAGLWRSGFAAVPCPRLLTAEDMRYRINELGIEGIIATSEQQEKINSIRKYCPSLKVLLTTGHSSEDWYSLDDIFKANAVMCSPDILTTTDDPCIYLFTSGTTGRPKAVLHNQDYPFFHWPTGRHWMQATPNDLVYNASDTGWGFSVWTTTAAWAMGAKILITPTNKKFNAEKILSILRDEPITIFCAAPTVLRLLVAQPSFKNFSFPTLKRIVTVGESLDETVISYFKKRGIEIHVGYGQAETPLLMGRIGDQPHISGTMGKPLNPYKIFLVDEKLNPLPPGSTGQIAVDINNGKKGLMKGYVNREEATKKVFPSTHSLYLTGDIARSSNIDPELMTYVGRMDDMFKANGYRIGPNEVERAGMSHHAIAKIAVVGVRKNSEELGLVVKAFLLLKPGYIETPELIQNIQAHIKENAAPYMYPRQIECLSEEEWGRYETTSGKIRRAGLREREEARLNTSQQVELPLTLTP